MSCQVGEGLTSGVGEAAPLLARPPAGGRISGPPSRRRTPMVQNGGRSASLEGLESGAARRPAWRVQFQSGCKEDQRGIRGFCAVRQGHPGHSRLKVSEPVGIDALRPSLIEGIFHTSPAAKRESSNGPPGERIGAIPGRSEDTPDALRKTHVGGLRPSGFWRFPGAKRGGTGRHREAPAGIGHTRLPKRNRCKRPAARTEHATETGDRFRMRVHPAGAAGRPAAASRSRAAACPVPQVFELPSMTEIAARRPPRRASDPPASRPAPPVGGPGLPGFRRAPGLHPAAGGWGQGLGRPLRGRSGLDRPCSRGSPTWRSRSDSMNRGDHRGRRRPAAWSPGTRAMTEILRDGSAVAAQPGRRRSTRRVADHLRRQGSRTRIRSR